VIGEALRLRYLDGLSRATGAIGRRAAAVTAVAAALELDAAEVVRFCRDQFELPTPR
jgi:hypothetical protein